MSEIIELMEELVAIDNELLELNSRRANISTKIQMSLKEPRRIVSVVAEKYGMGDIRARNDFAWVGQRVKIFEENGELKFRLTQDTQPRIIPKELYTGSNRDIAHATRGLLQQILEGESESKARKDLRRIEKEIENLQEQFKKMKNESFSPRVRNIANRRNSA